jgi:hypothetical protein
VGSAAVRRVWPDLDGQLQDDRTVTHTYSDGRIARMDVSD